MKTADSALPVLFVYFDVGGVLIRDFSDSTKGVDMLQDFGLSADDAPRFRELWGIHAAPSVNVDYHADNFHGVIEENFGFRIPEGYSLTQHGFVNRFQPNPSINQAVGALVRRVRMGLLTNMYPGMLDAIHGKEKLLPNVHLGAVVESSEVGLQKPDKAIYEHATELA